MPPKISLPMWQWIDLASLLPTTFHALQCSAFHQNHEHHAMPSGSSSHTSTRGINHHEPLRGLIRVYVSCWPPLHWLCPGRRLSGVWPPPLHWTHIVFLKWFLTQRAQDTTVQGAYIQTALSKRHWSSSALAAAGGSWGSIALAVGWHSLFLSREGVNWWWLKNPCVLHTKKSFLSSCLQSQ